MRLIHARRIHLVDLDTARFGERRELEADVPVPLRFGPSDVSSGSSGTNGEEISRMYVSPNHGACTNRMDVRNEAIEPLEKALETEDPSEKNFHLKQALQLLDVAPSDA